MLFTLFMPTYQFKRKSKARYIGKKATFECISCAKNDVKTYHTMSNCPSCHWYCIKVQKILTIGFSYTSIGQTYFHKTEIFWWVLLEIAASMHSPFCQIWIYNWYIINLIHCCLLVLVGCYSHAYDTLHIYCWQFYVCWQFYLMVVKTPTV